MNNDQSLQNFYDKFTLILYSISSIETERQTNRETYRQRDRHRERETGRGTDK